MWSCLQLFFYKIWLLVKLINCVGFLNKVPHNCFEICQTAWQVGQRLIEHIDQYVFNYHVWQINLYLRIFWRTSIFGSIYKRNIISNYTANYFTNPFVQLFTHGHWKYGTYKQLVILLKKGKHCFVQLITYWNTFMSHE